jgi:hypothetical protein
VICNLLHAQETISWKLSIAITEEIQSITKSEEDSKLEPLDSNPPQGIEDSKTPNNSTASRMRRA